MGDELMDRKGTFTLYDAGLFFVFLLIASTVLSSVISLSYDVDERMVDGEFCENSRRALLASTIRSTSYDCGHGSVIREDMTVRELLLEELYLMENGITTENISYHQHIRKLANGFFKNEGWILHASGNEELIVYKNGLISNTKRMQRRMGDEVRSSSWMGSGYSGEEVQITLYIYDAK